MGIKRRRITGIIVTAFFVIGAAAVVGQEKIEISTNPPPAAAKFPILKEVGTAKVSFWAAKNQLISESAYFGITLNEDERLNIKARFVTEGKSVLRPSSINLDIYASSIDRKYVDNRGFKIILDGKEFLNTTSDVVWTSTDGRWIGAGLKVSIPYDDFVKISQAKLVTFIVGPLAYTLDDAAMQTVNDILKTVGITAPDTGTGQGSGYGRGNGNGTGQGSGIGTGQGLPGTPPRGDSVGLKLLSKPRPAFTDLACREGFSGTVILRVTFLASGEIGAISVVKAAPYGLTEQAIAAAKRMAFEPARTNGVNTSVVKQVEYTFSECTR